jgi:hypothetical protein
MMGWKSTWPGEVCGYGLPGRVRSQHRGDFSLPTSISDDKPTLPFRIWLNWTNEWGQVTLYYRATEHMLFIYWSQHHSCDILKVWDTTAIGEPVFADETHGSQVVDIIRT